MDPGLRIVHDAYQAFGLTDRWSKRSSHGFTWLPHERAQRIWTTRPVQRDGVRLRHVVAETELFAVPPGTESPTRLAHLGHDATTSALVLDGGTARMRCSVVVRDEAAPWVSELFQMAALVQAWEAQTNAPALAAAFGREPLLHAHPASGTRSEPDEILDSVSGRAVWAGRHRWIRRDFASAIYWLGQFGMRAAESPGGLTLRLGRSNLLRATKERHPDLGWGVRMRLGLSEWPSDRAGVGLAPFRLNELDERSGLAHLVGSWALDPDGPAPYFTCFLPASLYGPGMLEEALTWMNMRSRWVSDLLERGFVGGDRQAHAPAGRAPLRAASG